MKIAYLDTIGGIAGDMTMAGFISAGITVDELSQELQKLNLTGFELTARHVLRNSIDAVHVEVVVSHEPHYHRHLRDILAIIEESSLSTIVKSRSKAIFTTLADAEAKIHGTSIQKVHFHEVGALDSIVDIVGTAICMERFGIEQVYSSPVKLGSSGFVQTQHGTMPTPTPATLEILRNYPTVLTNVPHELTTPTGAAIVKALSSGTLTDEAITAETIGYGAGTKELDTIPNLLRVVVGTLEPSLEQDRVVVVETNIDDLNPQLYPYVLDKLLASGAHDAYLTTTIMKKGRPGILLTAITPETRLDTIIDVLYQQTSTTGLRIQRIGRRKLTRTEIEINTSFGLIKAKSVIRNGREITTAEFEECKRIAEERRVPVLEVMRILEHELGNR